MSFRRVVPYRGYEVIAAVRDGAPAAQVFLGRSLASKQRFTGSTVEEAIGHASAWIDAERKVSAAARRAGSYAGTVDEYVRCFSSHDMPDHARAMLKAHAEAPGRTMTAGELAAAAGWQDYSSANLHYGMYGDSVAHYLELELPHRKSDGRRIGTYALAENADAALTSDDGLFRWKMYDEVAEALRIVGIAK